MAHLPGDIGEDAAPRVLSLGLRSFSDCAKLFRPGHGEMIDKALLVDLAALNQSVEGRVIFDPRF